MSEINLSAAVRTSLTELQTTAELLTQTQERLATGNRVNSALDDPTAFFTAASLNDRASDLSTLLDAQGQAIQVVEAADQGISAITDLVDSARAIANQALQTDNAEERAAFAQQFDDILGQIESLAGDASFNGINLLDSENSTDLTVVFNEDNTASLTVQGVNFTDAEAGLGLNRISSGNNATGIGASTPSATQAADTNFTLGSTANFSVGNSNGSTTDFSVQFQGADGQAEIPSTAAAEVTDFTVGTPFSIIDGVGNVNSITLQTQDVLAVDGSLNAAGGDLTVGDFSAGDTLAITIDDGASTPQTFTLTLDGTVTDFPSLETFIGSNTPPGVNLTVGDSVTGGGVGTFDLSSPDGDVSFTFTNSNREIGSNTGSGAPGVVNATVADLATGGTDFNDLEIGDVITFDNGTDPAAPFSFTVTATTLTAISAAGAAINDQATALAAEITTALGARTDIAVTADGSGGLNFTTENNNESVTVSVQEASGAATESAASTNFVVAESDGLSADDIAEQINGAGLNVQAAVNSDGTLTFSSANGTDGDFQITDGGLLNIQGAGFQDAIVAGSFTDADIESQILAAAEAAGLDVAGGAFTIASSVIGVNTTFTFASDTGDISVTDDTGTLITSTTAAGGTDVPFGAGNGGGSDFQTIDAINETLQSIDDALGILRATATALGSDLSTIQIRSDFTENLINTLEVGAGNLTLADLNEEGANLLTLQTRQQLASTSLSFATQADQAVLSLF